MLEEVRKELVEPEVVEMVAILEADLLERQTPEVVAVVREETI